MNTVDILLLIPLGIAAFNGYKKGLLIEIFGIIAFVAAIVLGFKFLNFGAEWVEALIGKETLTGLSPYLSFFIVFLPSLFLIRQIGLLTKRALRLTFLGVLDGLFGAVLGMITAAFGLSILLMIAEKIGINFSETNIAESKLYGFVRGFAPHIIDTISNLLPGGNWLDYLKGIKEKIQPFEN